MREKYTVPKIDSGVADKWDGTTKTQPAGSGTKADPYRIGTGAELAWFAEKVNGGGASACAVLTADIDLNRQEWTSIGTKNKPYMGTFDGQNHIIHGIWSTDESNAIQGLFGYIGRNYSNRSDYGTVKNVKGCRTHPRRAVCRLRPHRGFQRGRDLQLRGFRFPRQLEGHFRHRRHCGLHDRRLHRKLPHLRPFPDDG